MPKKRIWDKIEQRSRVPVHPFGSLDSGLLQTMPHNALVFDEAVAYDVHHGHMWSVSHIDLALADDGVLSFSFENPADEIAYFTMDGSCGGDAHLELIEGPVISDKVAHPVYNMNRERGDADALVVWLNATLAGGTVIAEEAMPGGIKNQASAAAGGTRLGLHWMTDVSTTYAFRLTNLAGAAKMAHIAINFTMEMAGMHDYD